MGSTDVQDVQKSDKIQTDLCFDGLGLSHFSLPSTSLYILCGVYLFAYLLCPPRISI